MPQGRTSCVNSIELNITPLIIRTEAIVRTSALAAYQRARKPLAVSFSEVLGGIVGNIFFSLKKYQNTQGDRVIITFMFLHS